MSGLRVLIVNQSLWFRSGTEMYVRDLALGLLQRGHRPTVFSPQLGEVADEVRAAGVPVVDELDQIVEPPEAIHAHHTRETVATLSRFTNTPAIFVCHDLSAWHDRPPHFPQIRRFVAVDHGIAEYLVSEHQVPRSQVLVLRNAVDVQRFRPRGPLPARPQRALLFSNYAGSRQFEEVRRACLARGIALDGAGASLGARSRSPETLLRNYDLVFASGRTSLEARAVGAAVILCASVTCGPLITTSLINETDLFDPGRHAVNRPIERTILLNEIDRYDAADAAEVSARTRRDRNLDGLLDQLVQLYQTVIAEHQNIDAATMLRAISMELESGLGAGNWRKSQAETRPSKNEQAARVDTGAAKSSVFRFDHPLSGGWLLPEFDGRCWYSWLGECRAAVEMTVPAPGPLRFRCEVAHVVKRSILDSVRVLVNDQPIRIRCRRNQHGFELTGRIAAKLIGANDMVRIHFIIDETVRPCDLDSSKSDARQLGIALSEIELVPMRILAWLPIKPRRFRYPAAAGTNEVPAPQ